MSKIVGMNNRMDGSLLDQIAGQMEWLWYKYWSCSAFADTAQELDASNMAVKLGPLKRTE
jgi:hypothetical protein